MDFQRTPGDFTAGETPTAAKFDGLAGGVEAVKEEPSGVGSITSEITLVSRDVSVLSARTHLFVAQCNLESTVANDKFRLRIKTGTTTIKSRDFILRTAGSYEACTVVGAATLSSGAHTITLTAERVSGTGTGNNTSSASSPTEIDVFDMGPSS